MFTNHIEDADSQVDNKDLKNIRKNIQFCKKKCLIYFLSLEQNKKIPKVAAFGLERSAYWLRAHPVSGSQPPVITQNYGF